MTDTVKIPLAEAEEHMTALDTAMKAVEADEQWLRDEPKIAVMHESVKALRGKMCDMLAAFNAHAGDQALAAGPKDPPPPGG